jgi:Tol biopolymer transport system component
MGAIFSTMALMLSRGHATVAAMDGAWQVIFIAHDREAGMVGRIMTMDGSGVQPVRFDGLPMFYLDCSPDGDSLIFMAGHSAYIARDDQVHRIEAETVSAIDVSISNGGQVIVNGMVDSTDGIHVVNAATGEALEIASRLPSQGYGHGVMYDLSPEGNTLAYHTSAESNLYVVDMDGAVLVRLPGVAFGADWSPDGTMVAFAADWDGNFELYVLDVARAMTAQVTRRTRGYGNMFPAWTPDGRQLVYVHAGSTGLGSSYGGDLNIVNLDGTGQRELAHFNDEVVMGCVVTMRPVGLVGAS